MDDDVAGIDETIDIVQTPNNDDEKREDSCLAVMKPSYSSYPSPQTPIWVMRCALTQSTAEKD